MPASDYFTATSYTDYYEQPEEYIYFRLLGTGNISFKQNLTTYFTVIGGGGGGGGGGQAIPPGPSISYTVAGGGGGAGASGKISFSTTNNVSYSYQVGTGGNGGSGDNEGASGINSFVTFSATEKIDASGGHGGEGWFNGNEGGDGGTLTIQGVNTIINGTSGNGGHGFRGDGSGGSVPNPSLAEDGSGNNPNTIEIYPCNSELVGGGGAGGNNSGLGGGGGNGNGGDVDGSTDTTGVSGIAYGGGGGGGSVSSSQTTYGGAGKEGAIFVYFVPPPPPPPPPPPIRRVFTQYPNGVVVNEFGQENTDINLLYSNISSSLLSKYEIATVPQITGIDGTISSYVPGLQDISNSNATVPSTPYDLSGSSVKFIWTEPIFGSCLFTYKIRAWDSQTLLYEYTGFVNIELRYNGFNGCDTGPGPIPTRLWSRANGSCIDISGVKIDGEQITYQDLDEKRKATILQYKGNEAGFSKKQMFSRLSRGLGRQRGKTFAIQNDTYTNSNTQNLNHSNNDPSNNVLICSNPRRNWGLTNQSNVPGPIRKLKNVQGMPLYNYKIRRTYLGGGTKWPQSGANSYQSGLNSTRLTLNQNGITGTAINGYIKHGLVKLYNITDINNHVLIETAYTNDNGNVIFNTNTEMLPSFIKISIVNGVSISTEKHISVTLSSIRSKQSMLNDPHTNINMVTTLCCHLIETNNSEHTQNRILNDNIKLASTLGLSTNTQFNSDFIKNYDITVSNIQYSLLLIVNTLSSIINKHSDGIISPSSDNILQSISRVINYLLVNNLSLTIDFKNNSHVNFIIEDITSIFTEIQKNMLVKFLTRINKEIFRYDDNKSPLQHIRKSIKLVERSKFVWGNYNHIINDTTDIDKIINEVLEYYPIIPTRTIHLSESEPTSEPSNNIISIPVHSGFNMLYLSQRGILFGDDITNVFLYDKMNNSYNSINWRDSYLPANTGYFVDINLNVTNPKPITYMFDEELSDAFTYILQEGWNLIGWNSKLISTRGMITDPSNVIIENTIHTYNEGNNYTKNNFELIIDLSLIKPNIGYWIKCNTSGEISIIPNTIISIQLENGLNQVYLSSSGILSGDEIANVYQYDNNNNQYNNIEWVDSYLPANTGYFVDISSNSTNILYSFNGILPTTFTCPVLEGWNIIGWNSIDNNLKGVLHLNDVTIVPNTLHYYDLLLDSFLLENNYNNIKPNIIYWINCEDSGEIIINTTT